MEESFAAAVQVGLTQGERVMLLVLVLVLIAVLAAIVRAVPPRPGEGGD